MDNKTFKNLFNSMRNGNKDSFTCIYNELKKPVYTIIYRILLNKYDSEDVMQELFLRLYKLSPETKIDNPRAYIFQMARNMAITQLKKVRDDVIDEDMVDENYSNFDETICTRLTLDEALKHITISQREIISLRINADMKFKEIAKVLDLPLGTVLTRYKTALKTLKELIQR